MKSNLSGNVVVGNTGERKSFGMKASAKAYSILISGIYQYKVKAIIRELSTNAVDSEIQAKNLVPFEVHLPTMEEPEFTIRDFGTGLNRRELEDIYFNFFESTKEDSNDYTGFIGIGSKSPLCYNSKSFNVTSYKAGKQLIYSCFIGGEGIPDYTLVAECDTDEPNGLKIQVSVAPMDIYEFERYAREVYQWFKLKPKFIGKQLEFDDDELFTLKNEVFGVHRRSDTLAIMGNIAYPINEHPQLEQYDEIIGTPVALFFDIGEIEFNASREGLEYTPRTIKKLKEKFDQVFSRIEQEMEQQIVTSKSTFDVMKNWLRVKTEIAERIGCQRFIKNKVQFRGQEVEVKVIDFEHQRFFNYGRSRQYAELLPDYRVTYVHNDMKVGAKSRCQEFARQNNTTVNLIDVTKFPIDIDESCYIMASTLPKPIRATSSRTKTSSFMKMIDTHYLTQAWEPQVIGNATSKLYVVRKGYYAQYEGNDYRPVDVYKRLRQTGITDTIYGVSPKEEQAVIDAGFINAFEASKAKIEDLNKETVKEYPELLQHLDNQYAIANCSYLIRSLHLISKLLSCDHPLQEILKCEKEINAFAKKANKISDNVRFLQVHGYTFPVHTTPKKSRFDKLITKYPLLNEWYNDKKTGLYHYVLGVDYENCRQEL